MVVKLLKNWKGRRNSNAKLPPGPWRLPLIGNMHQLLGPLPHHILRELAKKHGPLMRLQLGEISTIVVSSPEIAKEVLIKNDIVFAQRPHLIGLSIITYNSRDISLSPYGSYWRQVRKICTTELLNAKQVQSFRSIREEEVSTLVKSIAENEGAPDVFPSVKGLQAITGMKQRFERLFHQGDRVIQHILDDHKERLMVETTCQDKSCD